MINNIVFAFAIAVLSVHIIRVLIRRSKKAATIRRLILAFTSVLYVLLVFTSIGVFFDSIMFYFAFISKFNFKSLLHSNYLSDELSDFLKSLVSSRRSIYAFSAAVISLIAICSILKYYASIKKEEVEEAKQTYSNSKDEELVVINNLYLRNCILLC